MAFPTNMVYVRWEFNWQPAGASGPIEIQDFGMWGHIGDPVQPPFPGWQNVVDGLSQRAANAWATNMTAGNFANAVKFNRAIAYHYDQSHLNALDRGESGGTAGVPWVGTGTVLPPQLALVVSTSSFAQGSYQFQPRRHRGRFYLPTPSASVLAADGRLSGGYVGSFMDDIQGFYEDLVGTFDNIHMQPQVVSDAGQFSTDIGFLRLGRVLDTQRRRRGKLPEEYTQIAV